MKKTNLLFLLLLAGYRPVFAQDRSPAMMAYDQVQDARHRMDAICAADRPPLDSLEKGLRVLDSAIRYLHSPLVVDMSYGNLYLKYRMSDVSYDQAILYALAGKKDSALACLDRMYAVGGNSNMGEIIKKDSNLVSLWGDPHFDTLVAWFNRNADRWSTTSFKTPYGGDISDDQKVAGLSLLWSHAKYNFVWFDHTPVDWDKAYQAFLPQVRATHSTAEYYRVLERFYALLKDGHSVVVMPDSLVSEFYSKPPVRTELVQGKVLVTAVYSDSLRRSGIDTGLEIISVDGRPVLEYAATEVEPYASSSTPQDMEVRKFTYGLLAGARDKPVRLEFRDNTGKTFSRTLGRSGYRDLRYPPSLIYRRIGDIGYLRLNSFSDRSILKLYDSLYPDIAGTKGLIVDVRYNGGGDDGIGWSVLRTFTDKPFELNAVKFAKYTSHVKQSEWELDGDRNEVMPPNAKKRFYGKPVILLVGRRRVGPGLLQTGQLPRRQGIRRDRYRAHGRGRAHGGGHPPEEGRRHRARAGAAERADVTFSTIKRPM